MKFLKKHKKLIKILIITALVVVGTIISLNWLFQPAYTEAFGEVVVSRPVIDNTDMVEWVMNRVEEVGINKYEAYMIIQRESGWREDICIIEPNETISCGIWMLNTIHNNRGLTNACKLDYKCATEWAIKLYKERGGWSAWSVAKGLGLK